MAESIEDLERRLERLENLLAFFLAFEVYGDAPKDFEKFMYLLRQSWPERKDDAYWEEFFYWLHRSGFPRRYRELTLRLEKVEAQYKEVSNSISSGLNEDLNRLKDRIDLVAESTGAVRAKVENLPDVNLHVNYLEDNFHKLKGILFEETDSRKTLQEEVHSYLAVQSLGIDTNKVPIHRFVPIRVYLSDVNQEGINKLSEAVNVFSDALGFVISDSFFPEIGSWYKRWFAKSKEVATTPEVTKRLHKGERALELATLGKYQANVDKDQAEAASTLIRSLENIPNAVCQIGSILLIKVTDANTGTRIYTRSLTPQEMLFLECNQNLFKSPQDILDALSKHCTRISEIPSDDVEQIEA